MALIRLFVAFFKIGLFGFGGGMAMLPLIFQTMEGFGIMSSDEFSDLVAISQVTPGPIAVNAATFAGYKYAGLIGSTVATLAVVIPAFCLMLITMHFRDKYQNSLIVQGMSAGIRPAVVGLIAAAAFFMCEGVLVTDGSAELIPCAIFVISAAVSIPDKINPIWIMCAAAVAGAFLCS